MAEPKNADEKFPRDLSVLQERTDMTATDLMRWFSRPYPTIRTWLSGRRPAGPAGRRAQRDLELLKFALRTYKTNFPVPEHLTWDERRDYIRGLRNAAERDHRVSSVRTAG